MRTCQLPARGVLEPPALELKAVIELDTIAEGGRVTGRGGETQLYECVQLGKKV